MKLRAGGFFSAMLVGGAILLLLSWVEWRRIEGMNGAIAMGRTLDEIVAVPALTPASVLPTDPVASAASESTSASSSGSTAWMSDGKPAAWRFAQAVQLAQAGDLDAALMRYRSLFDDPRLGIAARYNNANALLREAMRARAADQRDQALVMAELAKEAYRSVLRLEPAHWGARYNLERALRFQPDPALADNDAGDPPGQSERAATTMRGISKGLP